MMRDMTKGAPLGHLFLYAVPLLLGNWLQLAYNAVDSIIAGRFIGQDALAAEGIAGPVMNLVILAVSGLCIGAGVLMSEAFGAKNEERLKETLATTLLFGAALCCAVALLGVAAAPLILHSLAVPDEILHSTGIYLRITFLGAPFTFFYNALAAATVGLAMGVKPETIQNELSIFRNTGMRQKIYEKNGMTIIEDCYNAGPESTEAALGVLASVKTSGKRIAVLGDMLELGNRSSAEHYRIGRIAAQKADLLLTYGAHSVRTVTGAITGGMSPKNAEHFDTHEDLVRMLKMRAGEADVILFKGSRGMKMERVLQMFLDDHEA